MKFYGAIKNTITREEYTWSGASATEVLNDLLKLSGTCYGIAWKFAGDQSFEESNIYCGDTHLLFEGKKAVHFLREMLWSGLPESEMPEFIKRLRGF